MKPSYVLLLLVTCSLAACQSETGILAAVSGWGVDQLEFQVGVEREGQYVLDHGVSGKRYAVKDRNLQAQPFELLLRERR